MRKFYAIAACTLVIFCFSGVKGSGQTAVPMSSQTSYTFTENFSDVANWTNNFAAGVGANRWKSVAINATGSIGDGIRITTATSSFSTGSTGGVQRGSGNIQMLSTSTANSCAIELFLDFTGVKAGTVSFDAATVFNSTGDRDSKLKLFYSTDGTTYTELIGTNLPFTARNNIASSASISIQLPPALDGSATARLRFYEHSTSTGATPTGSQPKISIDNIIVTATATEPSTQTSSINFNPVSSNSMTVNWTNGNGSRRAVFMRQADAGTITLPTDGTAYTASTDWTSKGTQLGSSGYYCVYNGTGTSVSISNLSSGVTYFVQAFEYNSDGSVTASTINYLTTTATNNPNSQITNAGSSPSLAITGTTTHGSTCPNTSANSIQYTITNSGSVQADDIQVSSDNTQFVVSGLSSTSIAASGGTATFNVTFTPTSAGAKSATITVISSTSGSNSPTTSLTGTGTTAVTQTVTSSSASLFTSSGATLNGNVTALGVCPATTEKGFVYAATSTNNDPLVGGTGVTKTAVAGLATGAYTLAVSGLSAETGYTYKAYVYDGSTYTYGNATTFSTYASQPGTASSAMVFGSQTNTSITLNSWTAGNGANRIVIQRTTATSAVAPSNGTDYTISSTTGTGNTVIYNGNGNGPVTSSGTLNAGTQYSFDVYEYNGSGSTANYGSAFTASRYTLSNEPSSHSATFTSSNVSGTSLRLTFTSTGTSGLGYIIIYKQGASAFTGTPVDGTGYTAGNSIGDGTVAAFITSNSFTFTDITGLTANTQYTFSIIPFGRNSTNAETYNYYVGGTIPTLSVSTLTGEPTTQPTLLTRTAVSTTGMTLGWTAASGGADGYIVLRTTASGTTYPNTNPVDGTTYTAGATLGNATVEYVGSGTSAVIASLAANSQYSYRIYSYNGSGTSVNYYTTSPLQGQHYTLASEPTIAPTTITASSVTATTATLTISGGNGAGVAVFLKAASAVDFTPTDGVSYVSGENAAFGSGTEYGTGNYLVLVSATAPFTVNITGLTAATTYHVGVYAYNGLNSNASNNFMGTPATSSFGTLVAAPSTAASAITLTNKTNNAISLSWTSGNGSNRIVVARASGTSATAPTGGTSYTVNSSSFSDATNATTGTGRVVVYNGTGNSTTVTGLNPQTSYSFDVYEYNGTGSTTNYSSASSLTSQLTLSNEPTGHAASFIATLTGTTSISMNFSAANTITNGAGYLILRKTSAFVSGDYPIDGNAYSVGASVGSNGAVVNSVITNAATTTASGVSISADVTYHFLLVPFNWDASNTSTRNYYTEATIPSQSIATPSAASDVIAVAASEANSISSLTNDAAPLSSTTGSQVWRITVRDGGVTTDNDALPTIVTGLTLTQNVSSTISSWNTSIRSVALFDGTTFIATGTVGNPTNNISFSGLNISIADGDTKTLTVRLSLNTSLGTTDDGKRFVFNLTNANVSVASDGSSSGVASFTAINSSISANTIDVTATKLRFIQQPSDVNTFSNMNPAVTVSADDANNNRDLDYNTSVSITATGAVLIGSPATATPSLGLATFSTLQFSTAASGNTLSANSISLTGATSNTFTTTLGSASYSYRTLRSGNWNEVGVGIEVWERSSDGGNSWSTVTSISDIPSSTNGPISIQAGHNVTLTASLSADELSIAATGTLTVNSAVILTVANGSGTDLIVSGTIDNSGTITLSASATASFISGGTYNHNVDGSGGNITSSTSVTWNSNSNLNIVGWVSSTSSSVFSSSVTYGNFRWNSTGQTNTFQVAGNIANIGGTFRVSSTGSGILRLNSAGFTLAITEDFVIDGGTLQLSNGNAGTYTVNCSGSFNMTGGLFNPNTSGTCNINLNGSNKTFVQSGGTLTNSAINWIIGSSASITLNSSLPVASSRSVTINGTLICGTNTVSGSGSVTVANGGTLKVGSTSGSGAIAGNITASGGITLNTGSTVEYNGAAAQTATARTFSNLTINNNSGVTLTGNLTINGTLTLTSGKITTGSNKVTLGSSATISGAASNTGWVVGNLEKTIGTGAVNTSFEIGGANYYRPISLSFGNVTAGGTLTASVTQADGDHPQIASSGLDNSKSLKRYWTISGSGVVFNNFSVTANFEASDVQGTASNYIIRNYASAWSTSTAGTKTSTSTQASGFTSLGDFVIGESYGLPTVSVQPSNASTCSGNNTSFTSSSASNPAPTVVWERSTDNGNNWVTVDGTIDGGIYSNFTTTTLNITGATNTINKYLYRAVFTNINGSTNSNSASVFVGYTWTGGTSSDWNTASNWSCNQVPGNSDQVVIPTGVTQPSLTGSITLGSVQLNSGSALELGTGNTVTISGSISGTGTITGSNTSNLVISANAGTLNLTQTNSSTSSLNNLTVNNGSSATLGSALNIYGTITANGTLDLDSNNVVLKSNSSGTARVAEITGTLLDATNVTVERFAPSKAARKWSYVAAPVTGGTIRSAWQDDVFITGAGTGGTVCATNNTRYNSNGFDASGSNAPSMYTYNVTQVNGSRWVSVANTTSTNLVPGTGYRMILRGQRSDGTCVDQLTSQTPAAPTDVVLSASGTLTQGPVNVPIYGKTAYNANGGTGNAYTLIGNPYASEVSLQTFYTANIGKITSSFWFYAPSNNSSTFSTYNANTNQSADFPSGYSNGNGVTDVILASGQAFFVERSDNADDNVTFTESQKSVTATPGNTFYRTQHTLTDVLKVKFINLNNAEAKTEIFINYFAGAGTSNTDITNFDSYSFNTGNAHYLASIKSGKLMAIQTKAAFNSNDTVQLAVKGAVGNHKLIFSDYQNFTSANTIQLIDSYANTVTDIRSTQEYSFSINSNAASQGNDRFKIVFRSSAPLPVTYINLTAESASTNVKLNWTVGGEQNMNNYVVERSADGTSFSSIGNVKATGNNNNQVSYSLVDAQPLENVSFYRIKAVDNNGSSKYSVVIKLNRGKSSIVHVYPNPVKEQLNIVTPATGKYDLRIINMYGRVVHQQNTSAQNGIITVDAKPLIAGSYVLQLVDSKGNITTESFIKL